MSILLRLPAMRCGVAKLPASTMMLFMLIIDFPLYPQFFVLASTLFFGNWFIFPVDSLLCWELQCNWNQHKIIVMNALRRFMLLAPMHFILCSFSFPIRAICMAFDEQLNGSRKEELHTSPSILFRWNSWKCHRRCLRHKNFISRANKIKVCARKRIHDSICIWNGDVENAQFENGAVVLGGRGRKWHE